MSRWFRSRYAQAVRAAFLLVAAAVGPTLLPPAAHAAQEPDAAPQKTIVKADRLEARNDGVEGHYVFIGNVHITGTNLEITCDRLEIFSVSDEGSDAAAAAPDSGNIRRMLAIGHVVIAQQGRRATCGLAEVLPREEKIVLTEDPVVSDIAAGVTMKGTRMTAYRGERSMEIENPEVIGPALPNLGFPRTGAEENAGSREADAGAAEPGPSAP